MIAVKSFQEILDEMLTLAPDDVDKREGSIIYDALAPAAMKMAEMYSDLQVFMDMVFADTSQGDYLARRTAEYGIYRRLATSAERKGVFTDTNGQPMIIPLGSRFSIENLTFVVIEEIAIGQYVLKSETNGVVGNQGVGTLLPVEPIPNLGSAELTDVLNPGTDDESDASLYSRFQIRVQKQATSGNAYHYEQWALSVPGVGGVKVIPIWDGAGTVKVVLLATDMTPASPSVVEDAFNYIEQERPIGATVTVVAATALPIDVSATVTLASGATLEDAEAQFSAAFEQYLKNNAFKDELIRYTQIANLLLEVPPIIDYQNLLVNGATANIEPASDAVGVKGVVTFSG